MKLLLTALLTASLIGCNEYEESKVFEAEYCAMVKEGSWGAYHETINCEDKEHAEK